MAANVGGNSDRNETNQEANNAGATTPGPGGGIGGGLFLRSKLRSALNSSNDIISSISNRLSLLSHTSASSQTSEAPPQLPTTPPEQQQTLATREWVEGACAAIASADVECDVPGTPESRNSLTVTKFKVLSLGMLSIKLKELVMNTGKLKLLIGI